MVYNIAKKKAVTRPIFIAGRFFAASSFHAIMPSKRQTHAVMAVVARSFRVSYGRWRKKKGTWSRLAARRGDAFTSECSEFALFPRLSVLLPLQPDLPAPSGDHPNELLLYHTEFSHAGI
jgi:hypothetical protein